MDQGLKFISSSGRQDLLPPTRSPGIPVHLLTPCHLLVPKGFLEVLEFCPEVAAASALRLLEVAGPCLSPASFEPRVLNTELGTLLTAGTKQTQQDRVLALMELTSSGEMKQYTHINLQIDIMTVEIDAKKKRIGCCAHKARGRTGAGGWSRDLLLHNKLPPNAVAYKQQ